MSNVPTDISRLTVTDEPVVITGIGLATSLGLTADETWTAILANRCGAGPMDALEQPLPPGRDGCQASPLPDDYEPTLPREVRYLRWTIEAALHHASLSGGRSPYDSSRCAFMIGTTLHGMRAGGRFFRGGDHGALRDFLAGDTLALATNGLGFTGPSATTCSACSSSLGSVALAVTMLQTGQADVVVAGGYDTVSEYVWAGFNSLRLVADGPLLPFTRGRKGMKLGEGYGIVVLERDSDATRRGARVHTTIAGYGESADSHHLTQPHPAGDGAHRAMRAALSRAKLAPSDLGLVAAHATGTPDNDASERAALVDVLGDHAPKVPVVGFKSHLGHTLGGAGAVELILSALALRDQVAPACANVRKEDIEFPDLNVTTGKAKPQAIAATLNTSLGFGGANTCVAMVKEPRAYELSSRAGREVVVTGIGVLLPGVVGNEAFVERLSRESDEPYWRRAVVPALDDASFEHLLNARRVRRMSAYAKYVLAAATLACRDAGIDGRPDLLAEGSAILGTTHGAGAYSFEYYDQIVREGMTAANPLLFAEGVPNVGAAQLSLMLGIKGACQTIIGTRTAGLDALRLAWLRIASGATDRAIVVAGEETHHAIEKAYENCGLQTPERWGAPLVTRTGFRPGVGAVALVIESLDVAERRGARSPYASITNAFASNGNGPAVGMLPRAVASVLASARGASHVICSANATWIDRVETAALGRMSNAPTVGGVYDVCGELFSATPLVGIAAALLTGRLPALSPVEPIAGLRMATRSDAKVGSFLSVCSDWVGAAAAVEFDLTRTPVDVTPL
jgi:3-oxoacyl-[acyl-carrier-protein] synthase II